MRSHAAHRPPGILGAVAATLVAALALGAGNAPRQAFDDASNRLAAPGVGSPIHEPTWSTARIWNEALLGAIRKDRPKPPVHARNLFHLSVAMWDAWAAYEPSAVGYLTTEKHAAADIQAARGEAISHAAFRLLMHRFPGTGFDPIDGVACQPGALVSQVEFTDTMLALGYDPSFTSTVGDTPAALGNRIGQAVIDHGLTDGANEGFDLCYPDDTGYFPLNGELILDLPGAGSVYDPNHWQPLAFDFLVLQNGIIIGAAVQRFVGVGWGDVTPFGLTDADRQAPGYVPADCLPSFTAQGPPYLDPGCPPQLGGVGDEAYRAAVVEQVTLSSSLDPTQGVMIDISPGAYGNNPLGTDDGTGYPINSFTCEPYAPNLVNRGDFGRVVAEFWADGPASETPPGHWNSLANYTTELIPLGERRLGGPDGPLLDPLEWDVKLYLALNGAEHDAAIGAWTAKHFYDSVRPLTMVRYTGGLGQSSEPSLPSYHPDGMPLIPGLIELITAESTAPGARHEHLKAFCDVGFNAGLPCEVEADCPDDGPFDGQCVSAIGEIAIRSWRGGPPDPTTQIGGVGWMRAVQWRTYQKATFVTPPFPGYLSGHSTFSRSGAEVLAAFTGTPYFPGGIGSFVALQNDFLSFELGPSETVELQWATFRDAADEAGISRRWGNIHPYYDDYAGRVMGAAIGQRAFETALQYYNQVPGTGNADPGNCDPNTDGDDEDGDDEDGDDEDGDDEDGDDEGLGDENADLPTGVANGSGLNLAGQASGGSSGLRGGAETRGAAATSDAEDGVAAEAGRRRGSGGRSRR